MPARARTHVIDDHSLPSRSPYIKTKETEYTKMMTSHTISHWD